MPPQQKIPEEIKKLALSVEIYDKAEKVGDLFKLHIDQIGELDAEIRSILMGKNNSSTFVEHISKRLEIDQKLAAQISQEVNKEIFSTIKSNLQSQNSNDTSISSLERVGGFSVEKEQPEEAVGKEVTYSDRSKILDNLENPTLHHTASAPANLPTGSASESANESVEGVGQNPPSAVPEKHTEPLVDYLLKNPIGQGEKKVVVEPKNVTPPGKKQGPDPYREPIK